MNISLVVTAGPHAGQTFVFGQTDRLLVGRDEDAHCRLSADPRISRRHFLVEFNPPVVRLYDLNSTGGTRVNGRKTDRADLVDNDRIDAGDSAFVIHLDLRVDPTANDEVSATLLARDDHPTIFQTMGKQSPDLLDVPGFTLTREIGRGGMGVVYEARRDADGAVFAIKALSPAVTPTKRAVDAFLRESSILKELDHPNIVAFREMGEARGTLWFAMEYVPGPDASATVKAKGPFAVPEACRVGTRLLEALSYAHTAKFIHRDIKPHNILLAGDDVKLSDFGLAKAFQESQLGGPTLDGEQGGTPLYMAPEQVTSFRTVGPAADQYSAAATLYFLLSGKAIVEPAGDNYARMLQVINETPIPLKARRPDVPDDLAAAVHRGLARKPADRFANVAEFAKAIRQWVGGTITA